MTVQEDNVGRHSLNDSGTTAQESIGHKPHVDCGGNVYVKRKIRYIM